MPPSSASSSNSNPRVILFSEFISGFSRTRRRGGEFKASIGTPRINSSLSLYAAHCLNSSSERKENEEEPIFALQLARHHYSGAFARAHSVSTSGTPQIFLLGSSFLRTFPLPFCLSGIRTLPFSPPSWKGLVTVNYFQRSVS